MSTPPPALRAVRVLDFDRRCPEDVHQHFALPCDRYHVAFIQDDVRGRIHDLAPAPNAQDEEARIGHQRLSLATRRPTALPPGCTL